MRALRSRVPYVAALGLLVQLTGIAVSPLALCCMTKAPAATTPSDDHECCKALGPGQVCPLHQQSKPSAQHQGGAEPAKSDCAIKSGCKMPDLALLSMLAAGVVSPKVSLIVELTSAPVHGQSFELVARDFVPDPPPPRV
jgi:hypothetical protein